MPSPITTHSVYYNEALRIYARADEIINRYASINAGILRIADGRYFYIPSDDFFHISGNYVANIG